jgi:hypothetical protein
MNSNRKYELIAHSPSAEPTKGTRGVALPFTLKCILRAKKNYGSSNISPCKNVPNLQKNF